MSRCGYQSLFYIFFAWILAACGGGGGGGGVDASDGNIGTGTSGLNTMTLTLLDSSNREPTSSVSNNTPGILAATVADSNGNPVVGQVVTFELEGSIGSLNPSSGTALTDRFGVAELGLNAGTTAGAGTVKATTNFAFAQNLSFSSAGDSPTDQDDGSSSVGTTITLTITKDSDGSPFDFPTEMVTQNEPAILTAEIRDASGPISGRAVSFETTAGSVSLSNTLSNTSGQASVTLTAGSIRTAGTATASFGGISATVDFETAGDDQAGSTDPTIISVTLTDSNGNPLPSNTITESTPGRINISLTRGGAVRSNRLVTVTATNGLLDPRDSSGAASTITDSNGEASVDLLAGGLSGAGEISVVTDGSTADSVIAFQIQSADIQIGDNSSGTFSQGTLELGSSTLSSGSTTTVSAYLVDANNANAPYSTPTSISFSSQCSNSGEAVIDATQITNGTTGIATAAYVSKGSTGSCSGSDLITATANIGGSAITAQSTITVISAPAASIAQEGDANPTVIALQNTSGLGRQTSSTITFKVLDSNGFAASGIDVNFEASTTVGGITLTPSSATSLSDGTVQVQVNAGTIPTPVRIRAFFDQGGTEISTLSEQLSISTGIPDNNSFSISFSQTNILGFENDGAEVEVTARGADHFNNPAPDGTTFSFISELGGSVDPQCTISNGEGSCTVTFRTQGTKAMADQTANVTAKGRNDRFGRTTVLAYAIGEESYGDANANNYYDVGEVVAQLPEAFIDLNESGSRNSTVTPPSGNEWSTRTFEEFVDFNSDSTYTNADTLYNGTLCSDAAITANHCVSLLHVRDQGVIVSSAEDLLFYVFAEGADTGSINFYQNNSGGAATLPPQSPLETTIGGVLHKWNNSSDLNPEGTGDLFEGEESDNNSSFDVVTQIDTTISTSIKLGVIVTDKNGNPPASGTIFNFECNNCDVATGDTATVGNETDVEVLNITVNRPTTITGNGTVAVNVTDPNGNQTNYPLVTVKNL